jgi:hypothetical protein
MSTPFPYKINKDGIALFSLRRDFDPKFEAEADFVALLRR